MDKKDLIFIATSIIMTKQTTYSLDHENRLVDFKKDFTRFYGLLDGLFDTCCLDKREKQ